MPMAPSVNKDCASLEECLKYDDDAMATASGSFLDSNRACGMLTIQHETIIFVEVEESKRKNDELWKSFSYSWRPYSILHWNNCALNVVQVLDLFVIWYLPRFLECSFVFCFPPQLPQLALGQFWGICHETSAGCLWWPRRCAHWNGFHHQPKCHAALSGLDALSVDVVIFILGRGGPTKNRNVHKFLPNMLGPAASRSCWNILQGDIWREILDFLFSFWGLDACVTCNIMGIKGCPSNASTKNLLFFYGLSDLWASHKQAALPRLRSGVLPSQCFCGSFEAIVFNLQMKGFLDVF